MFKVLSKTILLAGVFLIVSCSKETEDIGCNHSYVCLTAKPTVGTLEVNVTIDAQNPKVVLKLYKGNVNTAHVLTDTLTTRMKPYLLELGHRYSAKVYYTVGDKTIIAVNDQRLNYKKVINCEIECYESQQKILDVRLKTK